MDLIDYDQGVFDKICNDYELLRQFFNFKSVTQIPVSALKGDNVIERSIKMHWYQGPTLLGFLETVAVREALADHGFRFPVQWVNRPNADFRGFSGTVVAGSIQRGEQIRALPSGQQAAISDIVLFDQSLDAALTDQAVTLTLDREIDLSRGDLIVSAQNPCEVSDQFEAELVWMDAEEGFIGRSYLMQLGSSKANATLTDIKFKYDINSFEHLSGRSLNLNEIAQVQINLDTAIPFEPYSDCPSLGSFVLIDRYSNATIAAGMIRFGLRRATNVHQQALTVDRAAREKLAVHKGQVVWLTGLSGAGKSTIANAAESLLHRQGYRTYILDGDNIRLGLSKDLGFSDADRIENIRRIAEVAKLMMDAGMVVITAFISPFRAERDMARSLIGSDDFMEVFVDTPLDVAESRDPKGLYQKARRGALPNFTGIDSDYEAPTAPDLTLDAASLTVDQCAQTLAQAISSESSN